MRDCKKNQQTFYYATYIGKTERVIDGVRTGQTDRTYATPVLAGARITTCSGSDDVSIFGQSINYDRLISTVQRLPITELSKIWIGKLPTDGDANYEVVRVAEGLDQNLYAVALVNSDANR